MADGRWRVEVEGRDRRDGVVGAQPQRYATAEMVRSAPATFDQTLDLASLAEPSLERADLEDVYARRRERELVHAGFMKTQGTLYAARDAVHVECRLSDAGLAGSHGLLFHPALIDGSAVGASGAFALPQGDDDERLELPLCLASFRASAPLQTRCIARVRRRSVQRTHDLKHVTLEFFDGDGRQVAELTNLASKRVRDRRLIEAPEAFTVAGGVAVLSGAGPVAVEQDLESFLQSVDAAARTHARRGRPSGRLLRPGSRLGRPAGAGGPARGARGPAAVAHAAVRVPLDRRPGRSPGRAR